MWFFFFLSRHTKLRLCACSDVKSLNTVGAEPVATLIVSASEDWCLYCCNSAEVIGVFLEENLAPIYSTWILYSQVIQYPIDFPFCHFSAFLPSEMPVELWSGSFARNSEQPLNLEQYLALGMFYFWHCSFRPLTKENLGNHFYDVFILVYCASFTVWMH